MDTSHLNLPAVRCTFSAMPRRMGASPRTTLRTSQLTVGTVAVVTRGIPAGVGPVMPTGTAPAHEGVIGKTSTAPTIVGPCAWWQQ